MSVRRPCAYLVDQPERQRYVLVENYWFSNLCVRQIKVTVVYLSFDIPHYYLCWPALTHHWWHQTHS